MSTTAATFGPASSASSSTVPARHVPSPVPIRCFPYSMTIAQFAVEVELGKEIREAKRTGVCIQETPPPMSTTAQILR